MTEKLWMGNMSRGVLSDSEQYIILEWWGKLLRKHSLYNPVRNRDSMYIIQFPDDFVDYDLAFNADSEGLGRFYRCYP